ncbi:hypothetical protein FRB99_007993 [Tulasnella sp. 403]|nr:hypothetical protein FRB99_007993 [Tulasnella sp. 403]
MPPHPPIVKMPEELAVWEDVLDAAVVDGRGLSLGERATDVEAEASARWRARVEEMPVLSVQSVRHSEVLLRRTHHLLTFIMHFYVHSQPVLATPAPHPPFRIPPCLSIPLMELTRELRLPPILTYSDNVLYNWTLPDPLKPVSQTNLAMHATFSLTQSERHFYITSARIELRGVEALDIMRNCMDEAFIGDDLSMGRIVDYLHRLAAVIDDLSAILMAVREECDPLVFYHDIRPWFRGWEPGKREWFFEGVSQEDQEKWARVTGPSAGQSSLIHALDIFLGVDHTRRGPNASPHSDPTYLMQMEQYMPRHHRAFLQHLRSANQTHVRALIASALDNASPFSQKLEEAYDHAVMSLKKLRDGHIRIATLYIVNQARGGCRAHPSGIPANAEKPKLEDVRGTGGTSLVPFLKECRDNTKRTAIGSH